MNAPHSALLGTALVAYDPEPFYTRLPRSLIFEDWISDYGLYAGATSSSIGMWKGAVNGTLAVQTTALDQPTLVRGVYNGRPTLRSDGVNQFLSVPSFTLPVADFEIFTVTRAISGVGAFAVIARFAEGGGGTAVAILNAFSGGTTGLRAVTQGNAGGAGDIDRQSTNVLGTLRVVNARFNFSAPAGSEALGFYNSTLTAFDAHPVSVNNTNASFGTGELFFFVSSAVGTPYNGDISRVLLTRSLTASQRSGVAIRLASIYGAP